MYFVTLGMKRSTAVSLISEKDLCSSAPRSLLVNRRWRSRNEVLPFMSSSVAVDNSCIDNRSIIVRWPLF